MILLVFLTVGLLLVGLAGNALALAFGVCGIITAAAFFIPLFFSKKETPVAYQEPERRPVPYHDEDEKRKKEDEEGKEQERKRKRPKYERK